MPKKILIADDEFIIADLLKNIAEKTGPETGQMDKIKSLSDLLLKEKLDAFVKEVIVLNEKSGSGSKRNSRQEKFA